MKTSLSSTLVCAALVSTSGCLGPPSNEPGDNVDTTSDAVNLDSSSSGLSSATGGPTAGGSLTGTATSGDSMTSGPGTTGADSVDTTDDAGDGGDCRDDAEFFEKKVYGDVLERHCVTCHSPDGLAKHTAIALVGPEWGPDYMVENRRRATTTAMVTINGESLLLAKPTNSVVHGGGQQISKNDLDYEILSEFIWRYENPENQCPDDDTGDSNDGGTTGDDSGQSDDSTTGVDDTGSSDDDTGSTDDGDPDDCISDREHFEDYVFARVLSQRCELCHNPSGGAKDSDLVLVGSWWGPNFFEKNREVVDAVAQKTHTDGESLLLAKPLNVAEHEGGKQLDSAEPEYEIIAEYLERLADPNSNGCDDTDDDLAQAFENVDLLPAKATVRKAAILMLGRLPTPAEIEQAERGESELESVLSSYMEGDEFYDWVMMEWNDLLLTDRWRGGLDANALLTLVDYPNRFWFSDLPTEDERYSQSLAVNEGITRSVLELLKYVLEERRPITEILTADYLLMNPQGAKSMGLELEFDDPEDRYEFSVGQIPGKPHAGMLTTTAFLNRYPTTMTNRNRLRSRTVFRVFLGTDILSLSRPIDDSSSQDDNPTLENPNCTICHDILDPLSGAFANWDDVGSYQPMDWHDDMLPPGFDKDVVPSSQESESLPWLAEKIVADRRFSLAMAQNAYRSLMGREVLKMPTDPIDPRYSAQLRAYKVQSLALNDLADHLVAENFDYRALLLKVLMSPYFRASDTSDLSDKEAAVFADLGLSRLLSPEHLQRKLVATTGYPWLRRRGELNYLLDSNQYRIFYGGIDSLDVTERAAQPNGVMANVIQRMSLQMSCWTAPRDFATPREERELFPLVEISDVPLDSSGDEIPEAVQAVRNNIVHLYEQLLGETHDPDDRAVDLAYDLFLEVLRDGRRGLAEGKYRTTMYESCHHTVDFWTQEPVPSDQVITRDEDFTIRSWMAVTAYLLGDFRFVYE